MLKKKLKTDFNWQHWSSNEIDLKKIAPLMAARILFDIFLINEFEHALLQLQEDDCVWGPVHTSVGQEAVAAGTMAALKKDDKIVGTHRAHHQFISKAINYVLNEGWNPVKEELPEEAVEVVKYTLAEIMGLVLGYCGGRGGSMHLRYAKAGILGTNAIVAGGIPMATGAAYAEKYKKTDSVVVCFLGDGAVNQGAFHEACNLAGLWKLPVIYFIENNLYAVATHVEKTCAIKNLSFRASSYNMDGFIVDGHDVIAVYETVKDVLTGIRKGGCPCIIEAKCYRRYHHAGQQPGSGFGYRSKEEEAEWLKRDAVSNFPNLLIKIGILSKKDIQKIKKIVKKCVSQAVDEFTTPDTPRAVRPELWPKPETASFGVRSNGEELDAVNYKEKEDFGDFKDMTYSDTIAAVTERWMEKDKTVIELGEEVANFGGGAYGATKDLPQKYPDRIINTPISEAGFVGLACGAAMSGMRPIIEIMFPDFALVAADQLFNQIGKVRYMYGGKVDIPIVARTRIAIGCGYGPQHSMDPVALYALFPGWRIVAPGNAFDYIGLFNTAMQSLDPVLIIEHHSLYAKKFLIPRNSLDYFIPFGQAKVITKGTDITILAYGAMTGRSENINKELRARDISAEIIDLRSLDMAGIDYDTIGESVKKTGILVIVEEAPASQSIGSHIAAQVTGRYFDYLDAPPVCITSMDAPVPVSRVLEQTAIIKDEEILEIVKKIAKRCY